jgi:hypothetical protein
MNFDDLLSAIGVKSYDELTPDEKQTYQKWYETMNTRAVEKEDILDFVRIMKVSVEKELANHSLTKEQDLFLKARLKNYVIFEEFLSTPDRARKALENMILMRKNSSITTKI